MMIPKHSKDVEGIRDFLNQMHQQACSLAESYSGPIRDQLKELSTKLKGALGKLPAVEVKGDWSAEEILSSLFSCLAGANSLTSHLTLELNKLKSTPTVASTEDIAAAVEARIQAGDLVAKAEVANHQRPHQPSRVWTTCTKSSCGRLDRTYP